MKLNVWIYLGLAVVAIGTALIIWGQHLMSATPDEDRIAATRARLIIMQPLFERVEPNAEVTLVFRIRNVGKEPARDLDILTAFGDEPLAADPLAYLEANRHGGRHHQHKVLDPEMMFTNLMELSLRRTGARKRFTEADIVALRENRLRPYVFGRVTYTDRFKTPRFIHFCFRWRYLDGTGFGGFFLCDTFNDAN